MDEDSSALGAAFTSIRRQQNFCQFWQACWKDAWSQSWAWVGIVNLILSILIPFAPLLDPHFAQHQTQWAWVNLYIVALGSIVVAWGILLTRLLVWAPYDRLRTLQTQNKKDLDVIRQRFGEIHSALDDKLAKAEAQHNVAERIVRAREVLRTLDNPNEFLKVADSWNKETELFLANDVGSFASVTFAIPHSLGPVDLSDPIKAGRQLILAKIIALDNIATNIDTYFRPIAGVTFETAKEESGD
jgi:hypothetical protein